MSQTKLPDSNIIEKAIAPLRIQTLFVPQSQPEPQSPPQKPVKVLPEVHSYHIPDGHRPTEDWYTHFKTLNCYCLVVTDGHGKHGRLAAQTATEMVEEWTLQYTQQIPVWTSVELETEIEKLFSNIDALICLKFVNLHSANYNDNGVPRTQFGDAIYGGTTLSCAWIFMKNGDRVCHVAHVGDSDMILMKKIEPTGEIKIEDLNERHKPETPGEYIRIQQLSIPYKAFPVYNQRHNRASSYYNPPVFHPLTPDNKTPQRILYSATSPERLAQTTGNLSGIAATYLVSPQGAPEKVVIAMTRSLGDYYAQQYGLTHIPSQKTIILDDSIDNIVVVASDGVWDMVRDRQIFAEEFFKKRKTDSLANCVRDIAEAAVANAEIAFGPENNDDTTVIVAQI